jgi:pimeloyl-ACP methyl ester carboxylesterase
MNRALAIFVFACAAAVAAEPAADPSHAISVQEIGEGDPIIFLPGLGCRGEVWDRVVKLLPGYRAALVSMAGFGGEPGRQTNFANVREAVIRRDVRNHGKSMVRIFAVKTVCALLGSVFMLVNFHGSALTLAGGAMVLAGVMFMVAVDWTANLRALHLGYAAPSSGFVPEALKRLRRLESPRPVHWFALALGPLAGLNVVELALLREAPLPWRICAHLLLSALLLIAASVGFRIRHRRFERETLPLIDRLEHLVRDAAPNT